MIRIKVKALFFIMLMVASLVPLNIIQASAEGANQVSAHIDWSGINVTTNTSVSQTIQPLNVPPYSAGQVDWSIHLGNSEQSLWPSFTLSNSGVAIFAFYDVPAGSKVENTGTASCNIQAGNAFQNPNTWRSTCSAPFMPVAGQVYEFTVKPIKVNGSQWWAGFVSNLTTGESISLGRLENNPSQLALSGSMNMRGFNQITFWKQNLPPCSNIPDFSAVIGPLKTSTGNSPVVAGTRVSQNCPGISGIDIFTNPGSYRVNIGNTSKNSGTSSEIIPGAMSGSFYGPDIKPSRGGSPVLRICPSGKVLTQISVALQINNEITPGFNFGCSSLSLDGKIGTDLQILDIVRQVNRESDYKTMKCGPGKAVVSINASTGNYVRDLTITCADIKPFLIGTTPMIGIGSGISVNAFSRCSESSAKPAFVTGINAYAAAGLDTVQSICTPFSSFSKTGSANTNQEEVNSSLPRFTSVSFSGNTININVNIGTVGRPDQIYLVSQDLGISDSKRVLGKISGSVATWSLNFGSMLSGKSIPIKIITIKDGIESGVVEEFFSVPSVIKEAVSGSVPIAPKNVTSRVIGTSGIITAVATIKSGAIAQRAFLFGSSLGIPSTNPLSGEILATKVIFEIPVKTAMAGKTFAFTVYFENDSGKSVPTTGKISIPDLPKIKIETPKIPIQKEAPNTVFCLKGSISRTFAAKSCPPGWKKS